MSECVIIDVTGLTTWPEHHSGGRVIDPGKWPKILHPDRRSAQLEALRLAKAHPKARFVVMEAVAVGLTYQVPTHVNLNGVPLETGGAAAVVLVGDPDDLPF